jgi:hypothetical protein
MVDAKKLSAHNRFSSTTKSLKSGNHPGCQRDDDRG